MKKTIFISLVFIFLIFFSSASWPEGSTDKTPSINTFTHGGGYYCSWDDAYYNWFDEHVDFCTATDEVTMGKVTRGQPQGTYENCWHDYVNGSYYNDIKSWFQSKGLHRDSAFAHYSENTYQVLRSVGLFVPGWNPALTDLNNNFVRDYKADYDYGSNFTLSGAVITDNGGGQMGSWTANEWAGSYLQIGYSGGGSVVACTVASNTANALTLNHTHTATTPVWFIVDKDPTVSHHQAVAMTDSVAHIYLYGTTPSEQRVVFNVRNPYVQAWAGHNQHAHASVTGYFPVALFEDNVFPYYSWEQQGLVMGGKTLEDFENYWIRGFRDFLSEIKDSCGSSVIILANTANYLRDVWGACLDTVVGNIGGTGSHIDGYWMEYGLRSIQYRDGWTSCKATIEARKHFAKYQMLHGRNEPIAGDVARALLITLCQYYLVKDQTDSLYFLYNTDAAYGVEVCDSTTWWRPIMSVDMGKPTSVATEVLENGAYIWRRSFDNGLVLYKPRPLQTSNYTDATTHSLTKYYYRLDINGNIIGDSVNQVSLRNAEGVILRSTSVSQPPNNLSAPTPISPPNGTTIDTSSQTFLEIEGVQDPQGRALLYNFELDVSDQFNTTFKKESTPFELETTSDTVKWAVPVKLSYGTYYWRSWAYTSTYPSDTSPPCSTYCFRVPGAPVLSKVIQEIYFFPNPFKPSQGEDFVTFRNIPLNSKIIITTLSGELVRELTGNTSTDVVWDVKNKEDKDLASGIYFYRVDFQSGSSNGKLAVIR